EEFLSQLQISDAAIKEDEKLGGPNADLRKVLEKSITNNPDMVLPDEMPLPESLVPKKSQRIVKVTLERAIRSGTQHNLNVQLARLAPAVQGAQVASAEAAFDWVFFENFSWTATDEPRAASAIGGSAVGVSSDQRQVVDLTTGLRKKLDTG